MNEKVKEIKRAEKLKRNVRMHGIGSGVLSSSTAISSSVGGSGISSKDFNSGSSFSSSTAVKAATKPAAVVGGGKALKLGSKTTTEDIFLEQLRSEGQELLSAKVGCVFIFIRKMIRVGIACSWKTCYVMGFYPLFG